jgi:hypothetical protein
MIIPSFKEVYTKTIDGGIVKTECSLIAIDGKEVADVGSESLFVIGKKISFGISKTHVKSKYNKNLAMKLSYAMAMRFLILKLNDGKKFVEDNIK